MLEANRSTRETSPDPADEGLRILARIMARRLARQLWPESDRGEENEPEETE